MNKIINKYMKKNTKIYNQGIKKNILGIKSILKKLKIKEQPPLSLYEDILNCSSSQITSKWLSGRKYCRTHFVQKMFGKLYPIKHTQSSLCIDAMVNILDDLLDEPLNKKSKAEYVIEFLRIFSIYNSEYTSKKNQKSIEKYFNKLITLAIAENFYQKQIIQEQNINKIVSKSIDLLICRGMDMDIFIEIALSEFKNKKAMQNIKKISRIFRAINILKKDIKDIQHDQKNNIETVIILVLSKNKINFSVYIDNLLNLLSEKSNSIIKSINQLEKKDLCFLPAYKFNKVIHKEKKEIKQLIKLL